MKEEWRSVSTINGEQFAMTTGGEWMPLLSVDNLDTDQMVGIILISNVL